MFYDFFKRNLILVTALGSLGAGAVGGTTVYVARATSSGDVIPLQFNVELAYTNSELGSFKFLCDLSIDVSKGCRYVPPAKNGLGAIIKYHELDHSKVTVETAASGFMGGKVTGVTWGQLQRGVVSRQGASSEATVRVAP
ncbi:MAG: hypothetical protein HZA67_11985 [Rhodospirillales bacterium]|nr:hypothetical protein [Rhodospirillales bacterium]